MLQNLQLGDTLARLVGGPPDRFIGLNQHAGLRGNLDRLIRRPPDWLFLLAEPGEAALAGPLLRALGKADRWIIAQYDSLRADVEDFCRSFPVPGL